MAIKSIGTPPASAFLYGMQAGCGSWMSPLSCNCGRPFTFRLPQRQPQRVGNPLDRRTGRCSGCGAASGLHRSDAALNRVAHACGSGAGALPPTASPPAWGLPSSRRRTSVLPASALRLPPPYIILLGQSEFRGLRAERPGPTHFARLP